MPAPNKKLITIDCFPHDNVRRVAYRYGGILRNGDSDTTNPFVEVLLIELVTEVSKGNQWLNLKRCSTFLVPLLDIDTVEQCSIWEGNVLTDEIYNFSGQLITKKFSFNFNEHKPRNIKIADRISNTFKYYIPLKKIYLPQKSDFVLHGYPFTKYSDESYKKVNHCLMVSNNNIQVITSSSHMLILFSRTKEIRGLLLSTPVDSIINRYLESYTTEIIENQIEYKVKFRKPYNSFGENDKIFLTNLALNQHVINTVETLQQSMEITDFSPYHPRNQARYPIIYPPHPTQLSVEVEGIWLDDNKSRFFVTRFKKVESINDHFINVDTDVPNTAPKNNDNSIPKERSKDKNQHINTQQPPSRVNGEYRQRSNVETDNTKSVLRYTFNELIDDPIEVDSNVQPYTDNSQDVETSSDQPYGNEKTKTKKSETTDKTPKRDDRFDIQYIIESLQSLKLENDSLLQKVYAINKFGDEIEGFSLLQIKELVPNRTHPSWIDDKLGRQLLFLKLELKDRIDHCYLIDINKNKNRERFYAFFIITSHRLTGEQISKICIELESAKGTKKWTTNYEHFTRQIIYLKHFWETPDEWKNKFKNLFKALNKNYSSTI